MTKRPESELTDDEAGKRYASDKGGKQTLEHRRSLLALTSALHWRPVTQRSITDDGFAPWVRELRGKSGVYAIREHAALSTHVRYVGESHTGTLYKTLTRHFQAWHRAKKFWRGQYAPDQTDPGHTYERRGIEVAVRVAEYHQALDLQTEWIHILRPSDNQIYYISDDKDEVPF